MWRKNIFENVNREDFLLLILWDNDEKKKTSRNLRRSIVFRKETVYSSGKTTATFPPSLPHYFHLYKFSLQTLNIDFRVWNKLSVRKTPRVADSGICEDGMSKGHKKRFGVKMRLLNLSCRAIYAAGTKTPSRGRRSSWWGELGGGSPKLPSSPLLVKYWTPLGGTLSYLHFFFPRGSGEIQGCFSFSS